MLRHEGESTATLYDGPMGSYTYDSAGADLPHDRLQESAVTDSKSDMKLTGSIDTIVMPREHAEVKRVNTATNLALVMRHIVRALSQVFRLDSSNGKRALRRESTAPYFEFLEEVRSAGIRPDEMVSPYSAKIINTIAEARLSDAEAQ